MKGLLYGGATISLALSIWIAYSGNTTQIVLSGNAQQSLIQTGKLPVQVQRGNGYANSWSFLFFMVGIGMGGYATFSKDETGIPLPINNRKPQSVQPIDLKVRASQLQLQSLEEALQDPEVLYALRQRQVENIRKLLGVDTPVRSEQLMVSVPSDFIERDLSAPLPVQPEIQQVEVESPEPQREDVVVHATPKEVEPKKKRSIRGGLDDPRYNWIRVLQTYNARRFFGGQGGGKTSKLAFMMGLDIMAGRRVVLINPFYKAGTFKGIEVFGASRNFRNHPQSAEAAIKLFVQEAGDRIDRRGVEEGYDPLDNEQHWAFYADETTNWETMMPSETMTALMDICLQNLRQANMSFTFVSHGDTNALNGGQAAMRGKSEAMRNLMARLQTIAVADPNVPGGFRCSGKARLLLPEQSPQEVEIPTWMREPEGHDYNPLIKKAKKSGVIKTRESFDPWEDDSNVISLPKRAF